MTDQELRELVRESIAKQIGGAQARPQLRETHATPTMVDPRLHASHAVYEIGRQDAPLGASGDLPCIIEPSVPCNHCNYCKSHGH